MTTLRAVALLAALVTTLAGSAEGRAPGTEVNLWVARDVAPGPRVRVTLNTRNVTVVRMSAYRLDGIAWLIRRSKASDPSQSERTRPRVAGGPFRQWQTTIATRRERPNPAQRDVYRSREINLPPLPPGVYLLVASGGNREAWGVVNVTHLAVVVKRAPRQALVWVCDHATGAPLPGARAALYDGRGRRLATGATSWDGVSLLQAAPGGEQTVVVERDGDMAGVPAGIQDPDGVLKMHFQTDRPIYRPGHTVFFKAILRRTAGPGYVPLSGTECQVEVRDARDNLLHSGRARTNALGTLSDRVELPGEGVPSPYTVAITAGKETVYGSFSVAEYRKPEFKVTVRPAQRRYLAGEGAAFAVEAAYYFGAPVPQAEVSYQIRRVDSPYAAVSDAEDWVAGGDGNLYARDTYAAEPFVAEGTLHTDDAGRVVIPFKTERAAPDSTYTIQCTIRDASRREVSATAGVPVYAAALRVGIHSDLLLAPLGAVIPVRLATSDLEGKPAAAPVTLLVRQGVWVEKEGRYRPRELARTRVSVPGSGRASARVPARAEGEVEIVALARDSTGRETRSSVFVWVAGPGAKPERERAEPSLSVRLDRRMYRPGDTAKVWVNANTRRPMLLTAEGADLWQHLVLPAGARPTWQVRTRRQMAPNAFVSASQWVRGRLLSDSALLLLPDPSRQLSVQIEPDRTHYAPGEPATYQIRTADAGGRPVSAEVALAVVDEALFALRPDTTPDLFRSFWGRRENVILSTSSAPEELSGGAYQRSQAPAPIRQQFLDTAHWDAHVTTGADGTARVSFPFPGNLTTWRATARAVTGETAAGTTTARVQVSRPVMLRLAPPRQIVQGDRLTLAGTIHNRTEREREFQAELTAEGVRVEGEPIRRSRIPAGGEATVEWEVVAGTLPESGAARLQGSVFAVDVPPQQRAEFADALRVGLRVVPRGVAERFAAGGVLTRETTLTLALPADRLEPATLVTISMRVGLRQAAEEGARRILGGDGMPAAAGNGSLGAANQLLAAVAAGNRDPREARNALARLSRFQQGGWGWWEEDPSDPVITARVLWALAAARAAGVPGDGRLPVSETLLQRGTAGALGHYNETNLWEYRALLAAAVTLAGRGTAEQAGEGPQRLEEVRRRGSRLSPYARLLLAQASLASGARQAAAAVAGEITRTAVTGPETAHLPAGEHSGWSTTAVETTAQGLILLVRLEQDQELQRKLAEWLARPGAERSQDEEALAAYALFEYTRRHPDPTQPGDLEILANGVRVEAPRPAGNQPLRVAVPRSLLKDGENRFLFRRTGDGEAFVSVEAICYRPAREEAASGIRVLRRVEARDGSGIWAELRRPAQPAEILRCTVVVWPDERADLVRVSEPIPAGAEFVDSEADACAREEVRDGAVIHYLRGAGEPVSFRYYLRAESPGDVLALPAVAEAVRQPSARGHSAAARLEVRP